MTNISKCSRCGKQIYWQRSQAGKFYPCDSADDRRDFHKCSPLLPIGNNGKKSDKSFKSPSTPIGVDEPTTPDFEPSLEQRIAHLERALGSLTKTVIEIQKRQPITAEDVGF